MHFILGHFCEQLFHRCSVMGTQTEALPHKVPKPELFSFMYGYTESWWDPVLRQI